MKRDNSMTRRFLEDAGIAPGMRVLEIGCGGGEVTQILAERVGPAGKIVAIDSNQKALEVARSQMEDQGIEHVELLPADVTEDLQSLESFPDESFDGLVGRRVLMYLPDPSDVLRRLSRWLRHGGLAAFEETDSTMVPARTSPMAAHDQAMDWLNQMLVAENANTAMGFGLPSTLAAAGLKFEHIRAEAVILGQGTQYPMADMMRLLQSRIVSAGIATQAGVEALSTQLEIESSASTQVYVSAMNFCAWAHKP